MLKIQTIISIFLLLALSSCQATAVEKKRSTIATSTHMLDVVSTSKDIQTIIAGYVDHWYEYKRDRTHMAMHAFSPDGKYLACVPYTRGILVYKITSDSFFRQTIIDPNNSYVAGTFSPGGRYLVTAAGRGEWSRKSSYVKKFKTKTGKFIDEFFTEFPVYSITYSPLGNYIAFAHRHKISIVDAHSFSFLASRDCWDAGKLAYSPDDRYLAFLCIPRDRLQILDGTTCQPITTIKADGLVKAFAFSPCAHYIATCVEPAVRGNSEILLWSIPEGRCVKKLLSCKKKAGAIAYMPCGLYIVAALDNAVEMWHIESGTLTNCLEGHDKPIKTIACSPSGLIVSGASDGIRIWINQKIAFERALP